MSGDTEGRKSWYDEIYDRAYEKGMKDGAEKERNAGVWHLPLVKPTHGEMILAVAEPFDRQTRRYARKHHLRYVRADGIFIDGGHIASHLSIEEREDLPGGAFPDAVVVGERLAIGWDQIVLWLSTELPEGFSIKEKEDT